ncbi:hypothetical protein DFQ13_116111 [Actinokineospora spheciospongiae]|nr:hypothetical protein DFQ13_116111 [Actinokineospora spheciospongiae]
MVVRSWTGSEAAALRAALRMSVRGFADHLGVAPRTVNKWESLGFDTTPRPDMQAALDTTLRRANAEENQRFELLTSPKDLAEEEVGHSSVLPSTPASVVIAEPKDSAQLGADLALLRSSLDRLDDRLRRSIQIVPQAPLSVTPASMTVLPVLGGYPDGGEAISESDLVHAAIPRLRRSLDSMDFPDDGPVRPTAGLCSEVIDCVNDRVQSRYVNLARKLPDLITELARAVHMAGPGCEPQAASLLTLALRAADGVAFKFGYLDLSARIIDLMRINAVASEDPVLQAAVAYVRTETFFATDDLDTATRVLVSAADQLGMTGMSSASQIAGFGALHMRAAVVAARAGKSDRAAEHLREARWAADAVPEGIYSGTAFGLSSLRIHELAVAVELGDSSGIEAAGRWDPPDHLPAERRSHYYIDLARARLSIGQQESAYLSLLSARRAAPEHTRTHPQVRQSLSMLLRVHRAPDPGLLDLAAWARAR